MGNQQHGKYEIVEKIAMGGMGDVFKGYDPDIDRYVAIKILRLESLPQPDMREQFTERFLWEARIAGRLSHPNIVTIYESGTHDNAPYIIMEYIEDTLGDLLKEGRAFSADDIFVIMSQCCEAFAYAHESDVLHRDIKPSNILIEPNTLSIKLTDFGIAKVPEMKEITRAGELLGTPSYMAPELLKEVKVDGRADLFSLAVILYQMITGCRAFEGSSISSIITKLLNDDPDFKAEALLTPPYDAWLSLLEKALAKDPDKRFQTAAEFKAALESVHEPAPSAGSTKPLAKAKPTRLGTSRLDRKSESADQPKSADDLTKTIIDHQPAPIKASRTDGESESVHHTQPVDELTKTVINGQTTQVNGVLPSETEAPIKPSAGFRSRKILLVAIFLVLLSAAAFMGKDAFFSNVPQTQADLFRVNYEGKVRLNDVPHPVFRSGDGINLSVTPSATWHFYILYLDSKRQGALLFPGKLCPGITNPLNKSATYHFPTPETSFVLGGESGKEEIHVIGYNQPFELIEKLTTPTPAIIPLAAFQTILKRVEEDKKKKINFHTAFKYDLVR